jgi:hypothetical protein
MQWHRGVFVVLVRLLLIVLLLLCISGMLGLIADQIAHLFRR